MTIAARDVTAALPLSSGSGHWGAGRRLYRRERGPGRDRQRAARGSIIGRTDTPAATSSFLGADFRPSSSHVWRGSRAPEVTFSARHSRTGGEGGGWRGALLPLQHGVQSAGERTAGAAVSGPARCAGAGAPASAALGASAAAAEAAATAAAAVPLRAESKARDLEGAFPEAPFAESVT